MGVRGENGTGIGVEGPGGAPDVVVLPESETRRPFGVIVASAVGGFRTLVRQHVELAKLEATEAAATRVQGAGMMGGAAVMGLYAVGFLAAAAAAGLALVLPTWAAILIVAAVFIVVAVVLFLVGRTAMRTAPPTTERTKETLKEDARWAKQQMAR